MITGLENQAGEKIGRPAGGKASGQEQPPRARTPASKRLKVPASDEQAIARTAPPAKKLPSLGAPRVALLVETSNAYARGLLEGVQDYVRSHGPWSIYLAEHGRGDQPPSWLRSWDGDGIIARVENAAIAAAVRAAHLPAVNLSAGQLVPEMPCVETDDGAFAKVALDHFVQRGFRHFAYCGDARFRWSKQREQHFSELVRRHGSRCEIFRRAAGVDGDAQIEAFSQWLSALPKPVAVFTCYDARGRQVLDACRRAGLAVPEEVAVLGCDNDELLCEISSPPLSSVVPNAKGAGWEAAALLDRLMHGEEVEARLYLLPPMRVAVRQSTDVLAVDDSQIARALQSIRKGACDGLEVDEVARHAGLSRRLLEMRFRSLIGRTPHDEIMRVRLERVKELLSLTSLTLAEIAERAGFRHVEYLSVAFKRKVGMTPRDFRAQHQHRRHG